MSHFKSVEIDNKYNIVLAYSGIGLHDLAAKVDDLMFTEGYKVEAGASGDTMFVKGDSTMRLLFGAFVKYFKLRIMTTQRDDEHCVVDIRDGTPELSGGIIGMKANRKEMARLRELFQKI